MYWVLRKSYPTTPKLPHCTLSLGVNTTLEKHCTKVRPQLWLPAYKRCQHPAWDAVCAL